jgi:hypothetical protein
MERVLTVKGEGIAAGSSAEDFQLRNQPEHQQPS